MSTTFTALAYNIVFLRERGVLKRIRGTPLPTGSYLGGVAATRSRTRRCRSRSWCIAGRVAFGIGWPKEWVELIVFVLAGVVCLAALGVAFAHVIPNFESTAAYVNAVFLPVVFVSFYAFDTASAPEFIRNVADALPLKPLIDGLYGAMVDGERPAEQPRRAGRDRAVGRVRSVAGDPGIHVGAAARIGCAPTHRLPTATVARRRAGPREPDPT